MGTTTSIQKTVTLSDVVDGKRNIIVTIKRDGEFDHETKIPIEDLSDSSHEYIQKITNITNINDEIELPFCLINDISTIDNCKYILNLTSESDINQKFSIEISEKECATPLFRRGNIILNKNTFIDELGEDLIMYGHKAKIRYIDYDINDSVLESCCLKKSSKCNNFLINNYETSHCNIVMKDFCQTHPDDGKCIQWLEKSNKRSDTVALELYRNLCSADMSQEYCEYFCIIANIITHSDSSLCDEALRKYCTDNPKDNNCDCFNTNIPDGEFYGAKECWLSSCVSHESRWLTNLQKKKRSDCRVTNCSVDINKVISNVEAKLNIVNDCVGKNKIQSSIIENTSNDNSETRFNLFPFEFFFLNIPMFIIILSTIIYSIVVIAKINKKAKHREVDGRLNGN